VSGWWWRTSPYFELLPELDDSLVTWAWEHGDPTPDLFGSDVEERKRIVRNKQQHVYPRVDRVIAISQFIQYDIRWPGAEIVYNGCDHLPFEAPAPNLDRPLRVGALARMGRGETFYKGVAQFNDLAQRLRDRSDRIQFEIMGRGTTEDCAQFRNTGVAVHLNATDAQRSEYLAGLDIFVSTSLWEGFNLPLVEAQMSGALAAALDVGAHPEVTPFVFSSLSELERFIRAMEAERGQLHRWAVAAQRLCRRRFSWDAAATRFLELANRDSPAN
jgi:glycosyltransferase involved in cell wall biosynthesis